MSGGSPGPTQTTAYNTNIPEYAKPYVMNMLGAGQNQLFTTTPGVNGEPGTITGFRPYQAYSSNPADYFAGPSSLQTSAYNAAANLQSPSQYQVGTQLAGTAGLGQLGTARQAGMYGAQGAGLGQQGVGLGQLGALAAMPAFGAGQQYASQVTDPNAVAQYMSPYQQGVTDVAKTAAVREAQMANQAANLASARSGTYGGARQALAQAERERGLLANLSNIQAQGSQSAYDRAIQAQQFGANLGLQGIGTGLQGIAAGQQGISQGLAGTAQGLQGVGAQQAGYAGAGQAASTLGQLGTAQNQTDVANINLQNQLGQQQQQYQQGIINQAVQDYATAQQYPYMQLSMMSNLLRGLPMQSMSTQQYQAQPSATQQMLGLAGTGASLYGAFKREGGAIKEYKAGGIAEDMRSKLEAMADTDPQGLKRLVAKSSSKEVRDMGNEILSGIAMANAGKLGTNMAGGGIVAFANQGKVEDPDNPYGYTGFGEVAPYDPRTAIGAQFAPFERLGNAIYGFGFKTKQQIAEEVKAREKASKAAKETDSDYQAFDAATAEFEKDRAKKALAGTTTAGQGGAGTAGAGAGSAAGPVGLEGYLAQRKKLLGFEGPGAKSEALMKALEERQAGLTKEADSDRYLRAAEAFAKFGSTAGPMLKGASEALGGFAKGESLARKEQDKIKLEGMKMQSDLEKAQRAEARGDLDKAEEFYSKAEDRANRIQVAQIGASAAGQSTQLEREAIDRFMADNPGMTYAQAYQAVKGAGRQESVELQGAKASLDYIKNRLTFLDPKKDAEEIKKLKAAESQILSQLNKSGGTSGGGKPSVTNW